MTTKTPACSGTGSMTIIPGINDLDRLSDTELLSGIRDLSKQERKMVLKILVHLIEIDRRELYLPMGYPSLFEFCRRELGYSRPTAGRRIAVARCMSRYPQIYGLLYSGRETITSIAMITKIITDDNADRLLRQIEGLSTRQIAEIVSMYDPGAGIRDRVRPVTVRKLLTITDAIFESGRPGDKTDSAPGAPVIDDSGLSAESRKRACPVSMSLIKAKSHQVADDFGRSGRDVMLVTASSAGASGTVSAGVPDTAVPAITNDCAGQPAASPESGAGQPAAAPDSGGGQSGAGRSTMTVLEQMYEVRFGADKGFIDKIEEVRALLSTKYHRKLELGELLGLTLDEYIGRHSPAARGKRRRKRRENAQKRKNRQKKKTGI